MDDTPSPYPGRASRQPTPNASGPSAPPGTAADSAIDAIPVGTGLGDVCVDVRCSVLVMRGDAVLLLGRVAAEHRRAQGLRQELRHLAHTDEESGEQPTAWVLPGGRPLRGESMVACARREAREETGMRVDVGRCQFVLEVAEAGGERTIDLVFAAAPADPTEEPGQVEDGLLPQFIPLAELPHLRLQPPIAGYVRGLPPDRNRSGAPYLGNLWRPDSARRSEADQ